MPIDFDQLRKPIRTMRKLLKKMPANPVPEDVHQFRTRSREIETILQALQVDSNRKARRILKPLRRLRRRAGDVRDMDVLTGYVAEIAREKGEEECLTQLLEYLGAKRRKYAKRFHSASQKEGKRLRRRLKRGQEKLARIQSRDRRAIPASVLQVAADLGTPTILNRSNLHPYRLKVKKLRNLFKLADAPDQQLLDMLGAVKDAIGQWHDWVELAAIAEKALDHGSQCKLIRRLKKISSDKYQSALREAEQLQKRYVPQAAGNKSTRWQAINPSAPMWSAAMKLAA